jgi:O-antigen/teichoic acid export membrane protein
VLGIDRAVGFTVLARSWSILSGMVTILLIARFLSLAEQGYYFTFSSLVSLQVVFELGFSFVVLQLAAHESSQLHIESAGEITGSALAHSRLASVLQKSVRWYSLAALLMAAILMIAGIHFFSAHGRPSDAVAWKLPWICVVLAAIFTFQMDPVFSFLEGCGFVAQVARVRLTQGIAGSALAWATLIQHHGLFAPAGIISGQAVAGFAFLVSKRRLLWPLLRHNSGAHVIGWRDEIWPFQWRMAVSFSSSYLIFPLFNPVLFAYRGAAEAGRMGMSLSIAAALGTVAYAWMNTKASPFGKMIARRDFATLDRVFFRTLAQSGALLLGGEAAALTVLSFVARYFPLLAARMLPIPIFALLMFALFLNHLLNCEALYLRAHKREPFLILAILVATLTAVSTLLAGRLWGATGVTIGYFFCGGMLYLTGGTFIFVKCRRLWHVSYPDSAEAVGVQ